MLSWKNTNNPLWIYPKKDQSLRDSIIKEFKIHPVIAQILVNRGFSSLPDIHDYLYAKLPDLHDPFLMAEMPQAVERICKALNEGENILIYGDNDVDGMTGTALLTEFLQYIGANVFFYVSTRTALRQRLIVEALEYAIKNNCKLLITVDCGITAAEEIAQVVKQGVDVIVTDHHEPTDTIPHCVATLNPKLLNNPYPNRHLTGVGVAFKLAHAVINQLVAENKISPKKVDLKRYLDLVALGTISDMGALVGENRILVRYGLRQLRKTKRIGLLKLMTISDIDLNELSAFDVASKIAPRLNSLGRIDDPEKGVKLLLIRNVILAEKMAIELDLNNSERQKIERLMTTEAEAIIAMQPEILTHKAIVLHSEKWHPGIIAILSARISRHYNKPVIVIAVANGVGKGSLRSIPEFPLLPHLKECSDILLNFGGHDFAAGLTVNESNIEEFKQRFVQAADGCLSENDVMSKLHLDSEVHFDELTFDFIESIRLLEPFGNGNYPPVLYCHAKQAWPPKVVGKTHLKFYLFEHINGEVNVSERMLEGIAFGRAAESTGLRKRNLSLEIAFTPEVNNFQGPSIQLMIRDFKPQVID
ncbi:MAG: single-stranded-DNA-specific exonuclease RecJ [Parachlamydiaceae bacterium]|nr:single-stranded-DNA-specific exonuclease RecJ [Parachlamydiaceae bacterium]